MNSAGDMALKSGLSLKQPARELKKLRRPMASESKRGIDESVGFDQSAVEIDTKGRKSSQTGFGDRSGQPDDLPRFEGFYVGAMTGLSISASGLAGDSHLWDKTMKICDQAIKKM